MHYQEFMPHPRLWHLVERHFLLQTEPGENLSELVIPDGTHGILFIQDNRFGRRSLSGTGDTLEGSAYIFGQKTRSVIYEFETGGLRCFGAKLRPESMALFTGIPASELTDKAVPARLIAPARFSDLEHRIGEAQSPRECVARFETHLLQHTTSPADHVAARIVERIHRQKGQGDIRSLAQQFNMGYKKMERLFSEHIGVPPKIYSRIVRFNATLLENRKQPGKSLTELGYDAGYFDQMHFIREVKHFTRMTPKRFFSRQRSGMLQHQGTLIAERLGHQTGRPGR